MKRFGSILAAMAAGLVLATSAGGEDKSAHATAMARPAAEAWLALVDRGDYAASWETAASAFKSAVTKEQWGSAVGNVRGPFGRLKDRKFKSAQYATSLPGAPDGEYVVLQYDATFANKAHAVETITPTLDRDGQWRVSGYFVR